MQENSLIQGCSYLLIFTVPDSCWLFCLQNKQSNGPWFPGINENKMIPVFDLDHYVRTYGFTIVGGMIALSNYLVFAALVPDQEMRYPFS